MKVFLTIILVSTLLSASAQKKEDPRDFMPTENVKMGRDSNKRSNRPKKESYGYIYVSSPDNVLYGNPCAIEATRKMGFEYLLEPKNTEGSRSWTGKLLNNLWVKSKLFVTRSPFWKPILKSKFKKCRTKSGDIVG